MTPAASHFWSMPAPTDPAGVLLLILAVLAAAGIGVIVWLLGPDGRRTAVRAIGALVTVAALFAAVVGAAAALVWAVR